MGRLFTNLQVGCRTHENEVFSRKPKGKKIVRKMYTYNVG
jgi:hypothetical protein